MQVARERHGAMDVVDRAGTKVVGLRGGGRAWAVWLQISMTADLGYGHLRMDAPADCLDHTVESNVCSIILWSW